jgi:uncharacterized protein (TIGR02118 family)
MIRLIFLLRRRPEHSLEEFQTYWRDTHGPLVASYQHHLRYLKYVQVHRTDDPIMERAASARGGMEPPYDGAAEVWWDSEDELRVASQTAEGKAAGAALLADERRFIDLPRSPVWLAHEYPQVNPTPENLVARERSPIVKLYFPLRNHADQTLEEAQRYWRTQHGPLIRRHAPATGMLRYVQVHRYESPLDALLREPRGTIVEPYAGHAEAWFDRSVARSSPEARVAAKAAIEDEARFIDFTRSNIWTGKEHVIVDRI